MALERLAGTQGNESWKWTGCSCERMVGPRGPRRTGELVFPSNGQCSLTESQCPQRVPCQEQAPGTRGQHCPLLASSRHTPDGHPSAVTARSGRLLRVH